MRTPDSSVKQNDDFMPETYLLANNTEDRRDYI